MAQSWKKPVATTTGYTASGAAAGGMFGGPLGAGIGAGGGLLLGGTKALFDYFNDEKAAKTKNQGQMELGTPNISGNPDVTQSSLLDPKQQALRDSLMPGTQQRLLDQKGTDINALQARQREDFTSKTLPGIANRFASFGGQSTPEYQKAIASASAQHELGLGEQAQNYALKQQALDQNQLGMLLSPTNENVHQEQSPGFGQQLATGITGGIAPELGKLAASKGSEYLTTLLGGAGTAATGAGTAAAGAGTAATGAGTAANALGGTAGTAAGSAGATMASALPAAAVMIAGIAATNYIADLLSR